MLPRMVTVGEKMKKLWLSVVRDHKLVSTSSRNHFFPFLFIWAHLPETKERKGGYLMHTLGSNLKPATSHSPTTGCLHNSNAESFCQWGVDQNITLTEYLQYNEQWRINDSVSEQLHLVGTAVNAIQMILIRLQFKHLKFKMWVTLHLLQTQENIDPKT